MVLLVSVSAGEEGIGKKEESVKNPHGDGKFCECCHNSSEGGADELLFAGDISTLCRSCHDGRAAGKEAHPVDLRPSAAMSERIPDEFPLVEGKLTCISCHNVSWGCKVDESGKAEAGSFLRVRKDASRPLEFCFGCHVRGGRRAFNVHEQLGSDGPKSDTCLWCHEGAPSVEEKLEEGASYGLRSESFGVCENCHSMSSNHPSQGQHMLKRPSEEMMWYMSAYELQPRMRLSVEQLLDYVRAAKRVARSIPLDEKRRITCYSCHNPHEKGVLPNSNPRSIGAEGKKAKNHRLRDREKNVCRACHQK